MQSDQHPFNGQHNWSGAANGFFTPPPTANWSGPPHLAGPNHPAVPPGNYTQQQQQQQMIMMMSMMQQMHAPPPPPPPLGSKPQAATSDPSRPSIPMDEQKIAQVLFQQTAKGLTYKSAIESMHGVDGFAAYSWKDFYLERKPRIDTLVEELRGRSNLPRPLPKEVKHERDASVISESRSASTSNAQRRPKEKAKPIPTSSKLKGAAPNGRHKAPDHSTSSRRTMNSLSVTPSSILLQNVPSAVPIDPYTDLPSTPSERPTPPVVEQVKGQKGRGNAYTEEDTVFFFKLVAWELANNDNATKGSICELLNELAPHHSIFSWKTFWSRHENVADKMLLLSEISDGEREGVIRSWKTGGPVQSGSVSTNDRARKKVSYTEDPGSDSEPLTEASTDNDSDDGDDDDEDEDEDAVGSTDDDQELGEAGTPFGPAEIRAIAKHIAATPGWFKGQKDWSDFTEKFQQRTPGSWREFYRRRTKDVDEAARKYMKRAKREHVSSITHQRGRPSWASGGSKAPPSTDGAQKRRFDEENMEGVEIKRSKHANSR